MINFFLCSCFWFKQAVHTEESNMPLPASQPEDLVSAFSVLWSSGSMAISFLIWVGAIFVPSGKDSCECKDVFKVLSSEKSPYVKCKKCDNTKSWRVVGSLMSFLPNSVTPIWLLKVMFWFSQRSPLEQIQTNVGFKNNTTADAVNMLRTLLTEAMIAISEKERLLGDRPNTVVCIDETFFTKRKRNGGGFVGRETEGHKTIVMGFCELDCSTSPRTCAGRVALVEIPVVTRRAFEQEIKKRVAPGATIWTDGHASYKWLCDDDSGFKWD